VRRTGPVFSAGTEPGGISGDGDRQIRGAAAAVLADFTLMLTAMKPRHLFESLSQFQAALLTVLALGLAAGSATAAAPTISLAGPDAASITDKQQNVYHPFSNVTINDSDGSPVTVSILLNPTGLGSLHTPLPAGVSGSGGSFTIAKATATAVTTTIHAIIFDPQENQIDIGANDMVTFTVWATDTNGVSSTTNSDRNVTITLPMIPDDHRCRRHHHD